MLRRLLVLGFLSLLASSVGWAQAPNLSDVTSTPTAGAGHNYLGTLNETVNPANGSTSLRLAVPIPKGRQLTVPFFFAYESNGTPAVQPLSAGVAWSSFGAWTYTAPTLSVATEDIALLDGTSTTCRVSLNYMYTDPSGSRHPLLLSVYGYAPGSKGFSNCSTAILPNGWQQIDNPQDTNGGDPLLQAYTAPIPSGQNGGKFQINPVSIADADGTVVTFPLAGVYTAGGFLASTIEDRNGNVVTVNKGGSCGQGFAGYTDSLGRSVLSLSCGGTGVHTDTITVSGLAAPYYANWAGSATVTNTNLNVNQYYGSCSVSGINLGFTPLSNIQLPDGTSYQFSYDSTYGAINKIQYPTGAYVRYVWGINPSSEAGFADGVLPGSGQYWACGYHFDTPVITDRYVSYDGNPSHEYLHQHFAYITTWQSGQNAGLWSQKTTRVTTTDVLRSASFETLYTYSPVYSPTQPDTDLGVQITNQIPVESEIDYCDWGVTGCSSTNSVRTVHKSWASQYTMSCQSTTQGGLTSRIDYAYRNDYPYAAPSVVIDKKEWDWGTGTPVCGNTVSGTPLRETVTTPDTFWGPYPAGPSIFDRPGAVAVNGSGRPAAQTSFSYDSVGNALTKTENCSYNGVYNCSNPVTTYTYDGYGNVLSVKDPNGKFTYYSYADQFTDCSPSAPSSAYPTLVTYPPTYGGVPHAETFTYSYHSGHMTSSTDENGQTSNYLYTVSGQPEPFARLTEIDSPDGGKTLISYDDNPTTNTTDQNPHPSVTTTKMRDSNPSDNIVSLSVMDGLAHVVQTQLQSAPEGTNFVETTYDGLARVLTVTNPHLSGTSPSDGTTCYGTWSNGQCAGIGYDALGRVLEVTHPDLTVLQYSYTGRATEVVDEGNGSGTNVTRISQSDALGHLRFACEVTTKTLSVGGDAIPTTCNLDIPGTGFLTSYQYDALGNLLDVHQSNQQQDRQFTYDSLSQVITASEPESGTASYTYDLNGNVTTRTRPAPNQPNPGATVTTSYAYDSLNRVTRKTYSDGVTLEVDLVYDQPSLNGAQYTLANAIGRLAYAYSPNSTMDLYSYDVMGRVTDAWQCVAMPCTSAWDAHETYDLAGDRLTLGYNTSATLAYSYDSAGRIVGATGSGPANLTSPLLSNVAYGPVGLLSATLGASTGALPEVRVYDDRTRLSTLSVASNSVYSLTVAYWPDNDVKTANDCVSGVCVNGNWTYAYDDFNRLSAASTPSVGYSYDYDRFGNRWHQNVTAGTGYSVQLTLSNSNQITTAGLPLRRGGQRPEGQRQLLYL